MKKSLFLFSFLIILFLCQSSSAQYYHFEDDWYYVSKKASDDKEMQIKFPKPTLPTGRIKITVFNPQSDRLEIKYGATTQDWDQVLDHQRIVYITYDEPLVIKRNSGGTILFKVEYIR